MTSKRPRVESGGESDKSEKGDEMTERELAAGRARLTSKLGARLLEIAARYETQADEGPVRCRSFSPGSAARFFSDAWLASKTTAELLGQDQDQDQDEGGEREPLRSAPPEQVARRTQLLQERFRKGVDREREPEVGFRDLCLRIGLSRSSTAVLRALNEVTPELYERGWLREGAHGRRMLAHAGIVELFIPAVAAQELRNK